MTALLNHFNLNCISSKNNTNSFLFALVFNVFKVATKNIYAIYFQSFLLLNIRFVFSLHTNYSTKTKNTNYNVSYDDTVKYGKLYKINDCLTCNSVLLVKFIRKNIQKTMKPLHQTYLISWF